MRSRQLLRKSQEARSEKGENDELWPSLTMYFVASFGSS